MKTSNPRISVYITGQAKDGKPTKLLIQNNPLPGEEPWKAEVLLVELLVAAIHRNNICPDRLMSQVKKVLDLDRSNKKQLDYIKGQLKRVQ